jgi:hypothetical protein
VSARTASWTATVVLAVTIPLYAASLWLGWSRPHVEGVVDFTGLEALWILSFVAFEVVGAVIVLRRPRHPIGWLFLAAGGSSVVSMATYEYAIQALLLDRALPAGEVAAWLSGWTWPFGLGLVVVALVLFPTGRPPSRRWWAVVWMAGVTTTLVVIANAVDLWSVRGPLILQDPEAVSPELMTDLWSMHLMSVAFPIYLFSAVLAMIGTVVRYRRGRGEERQQLKLLALVAVMAAVALVAGETVVTSGPGNAVADTLSAPGWFAVAAGVAVLRYRLYEIDHVISRTLAYAALTVFLVAVYAVSVLGLGWLVRAAAGGGGGDLVVAASTLAVAALFVPARRRIQALVDRRFNRARYDAQRTVEVFAQRLRDEVDLAALTDELGGVVDQAVQPRSVSVWLVAGEAGP